jgi:hypothetical protein
MQVEDTARHRLTPTGIGTLNRTKEREFWGVEKRDVFTSGANVSETAILEAMQIRATTWRRNPTSTRAPKESEITICARVHVWACVYCEHARVCVCAPVCMCEHQCACASTRVRERVRARFSESCAKCSKENATEHVAGCSVQSGRQGAPVHAFSSNGIWTSKRLNKVTL